MLRHATDSHATAGGRRRLRSTRSKWRNAIKNLIQFCSTFEGVHGRAESGGMTISDQMQSLDRNPPASGRFGLNGRYHRCAENQAFQIGHVVRGAASGMGASR
jgi:hypothetical protein